MVIAGIDCFASTLSNSIWQPRKPTGCSEFFSFFLFYTPFNLTLKRSGCYETSKRIRHRASATGPLGNPRGA